MSFLFVDPDTYARYKDRVLELSHAVQVNVQEQLPAASRRPPLSDREIAARLGLTEEVVREIRCVAERDRYPIEEFERAMRFKDEACRAYARRGLSAATAKYARRANTED